MSIQNRFRAIALFLIAGVTLQSCTGGDDSNPVNPVLPEFSVLSVDEMTDTDAVVSGSISYSGEETVVSTGICYATTSQPTVANNVVDNVQALGNFSLTLDGLQPSTQYYVRAFANIGNEIYYGNQINFTTGEEPQFYEIGDIGPGGGFVFYVNAQGTHGMEMAPASTQFQSQWGCYTTSVAGTSASVGSGQNNSQLILDYHASINFYANPQQCQQVVVSTGDVAAKNCANLVFGGKDDWYMPSIGELQLIRDNLYANGLGDIETISVWSSSTQNPSNIRQSRVMQFDNNSTWGMWKEDLTDHRAIRSF
jgi:hypothetical protein